MNWDTLEADVNCILTNHMTKGRSGKSIDKVVVHHNAGNLTVEGCYNLWQYQRAASAHFQVESGGRIGQLVWDSDTAWHAGNLNANQTSIGVEHANDSTTNWTISETCLDAGAHLVAAICKYYGLGRPEWMKNVFPHSYFSSTSCPGQIYGTQKDAYMARCQSWYDEMCGTTSSSSSPGSSSSSGLPDGAKDFAQNPLLCDGYFGPLTKKYVQIALRNHGYYPASKYVIDGDFGYYTKLELQKYLRACGYYPASQYLLDGVFGEASTKALQQHLHDVGTYWDKYGWCLIDGEWGDQTTSAIQRAINGGVL